MKKRHDEIIDAEFNGKPVKEEPGGLVIAADVLPPGLPIIPIRPRPASIISSCFSLMFTLMYTLKEKLTITTAYVNREKHQTPEEQCLSFPKIAAR